MKEQTSKCSQEMEQSASSSSALEVLGKDLTSVGCVYPCSWLENQFESFRHYKIYKKFTDDMSENGDNSHCFQLQKCAMFKC